MIARLAILEGTVKPENKLAFDADMRGAVRNAILRYPGIRDVLLRWPIEQDVGSPPVYLIFELHFDDLAAMRAGLASPIRAEVRGLISESMKRFDGRTYHLVVENR